MLHIEVILDERENPRKCTVSPVANRPDFHIVPYRHEQRLPRLTSELLLHVDGEPLDQRSNVPVKCVAVLDCIWRRCPTLLRQLPEPWPSLVRIPDGFKTAYPRKSKHNCDPMGGLATIEAIFIAAAFLGQWDESLLKEYHFADEFLDKNREVFLRYHLGGAIGQQESPLY